MHRLHPQRKGGVTNTNTANTTLRSQTNLQPQTPTPLNNGSHASSFSFRPSAIMHRPLPDSDLDDFEPLPDVADLFDDSSEEVARLANKRKRNSGKSGKSGKTSGSGSAMALAPTTTTTTTTTTIAKRARVSAKVDPTAAQTWQERHGKTSSGQVQNSFDDDDIDFTLDMLPHDDDHNTPAIATNMSSSALAADRSYSTMLNETVQQVDTILMGGGYNPFDLENNTRASLTLSQAPTGFHALLETRDEQQDHGHGSSNESLSNTLSGHDNKDEVRNQAGDEIRTEHPIQGTEDQLSAETTGEAALTDRLASAYSFTTPTNVNELEERLHGLSQLLCSTFEDIIVSVRGVENLWSSVKEATDVHFRALDMRDRRIQARKAEVQDAAASIQSHGPIDFSSTIL